MTPKKQSIITFWAIVILALLSCFMGRSQCLPYTFTGLGINEWGNTNLDTMKFSGDGTGQWGGDYHWTATHNYCVITARLYAWFQQEFETKNGAQMYIDSKLSCPAATKSWIVTRGDILIDSLLLNDSDSLFVRSGTTTIKTLKGTGVYNAIVLYNASTSIEIGGVTHYVGENVNGVWVTNCSDLVLSIDTTTRPQQPRPESYMDIMITTLQKQLVRKGKYYYKDRLKGLYGLYIVTVNYGRIGEKSKIEFAN